MKKTNLVLLLLVMLMTSLSFGQRKKKDIVEEQPEPIAHTPKLVVGIVVDQMRYDYLTRFWAQYGEGGFKRLVNQGFNCKNHHYNYAPTSTGPGHASVYTGTTPATHGIIGNDWYNKETGTDVYCAGDDSYTSVGTTSDAGQMSPHRMLTTTVTDELRMHTQKRGKVIGVALKDRGAILPAGHAANAAYWFEGGAAGNWITSSYYMDALPQWVVDFNNSDAVEVYKKPWNTLKPIETYVESGTDANTYEGMFKGEATSSFPHDLPALWEANGQFGLLRTTPYGNSMTADFALAAVEGESLGVDTITDFLAVSFSSTDYVGHFFGVNSKEIEDTYIRLDRDLARLFTALDEKVGEGEYTVFLTADHAAIDVPAYLKDSKLPAGYLDMKGLQAKFAEFLKYKYGTTDVVKDLSNYQLFLDHKILTNLDIDLKEAQEDIAKELLSYEGIGQVYTAHQMWTNNYTKGIPYILQNGYNQKRSGDVLIVPNPGFILYGRTGSTHGSPQIYDTHVPLLLYGKGIKQGSTVNRTEIPDIAPTISALLGIAFPSGTTGRPIGEVLE
ncbi:Type I phosphodiesterase / nucleotide pyrophosphatase [Flagellimonas taeanensis]|uniref:Type I phosphodiesterase / nucleotide pyrophosphatase n=1 Tax=Flagellimonas taeanensis TaxID=1005926 RepID=A0A1M6YS25_9FLAO|nr:alkaline phosphatase PafA [Allomuricauda taeanensis]SFC14948.1 Type I phosphodiesterase / nucleotide pyrophosphatase [Allomuricauda taeanensis]SHL20940.1 Type I phosphodiesterase / nucleotide pyrophosphatase [Allomuricauda taeanensis]